jgi:plastocyanin
LTNLGHRLSALLLAGAAVAAVPLAGCGTPESEPDLANGKRLFIGLEGYPKGKPTCSSCHVLEAAGAQGVQGPNLDTAFRSARKAGMTEDTVAGVVEQQIKTPLSGRSLKPEDRMPAKLLTGKDARDVAAYVAHVAGVKAKDTGFLATIVPGGGDKTVAAKDGVLEIPAADTGLAFVAGRATAEAGTIKLSMPNPQSQPHNIAVKGSGIDEKGPVVGANAKSEVEVDLEAGKYTFYCSVPGHEAGGMKGELTVE